MGLLALGAIVVACQGGEEVVTPTATPSTQAQVGQRLAELSADAVLALAFPGVAFQRLPGTEPSVPYLLAADPTWRIEALGRLIGDFNRPGQPQLAAFLYLSGPTPDAQAQPRSRLLNLPEGLFIAFIELDTSDQPALVGLSLLDASAQEFLEAATALEQNRRPFRQGVDNLAPQGTIDPALAVDTNNDGLDEITLLDTGVADGIAAAFYLTFQRANSGLHWQRIAPAPDGTPADHLPTQAVLDYLAAVAAATSTAEPWQEPERLRVLEWLTGPEEAVPPELLQELATGDDPAAQEATRRKLEATRRLFSEAYDHFSPNRQKLQPWPDFVDGFRNATGVTVDEMSPPTQKNEHTLVQVMITTSSREGPDLVQRHFQVTYTLVQVDGDWRLDSVDAREERPTEQP